MTKGIILPTQFPKHNAVLPEIEIINDRSGPPSCNQNLFLSFHTRCISNYRLRFKGAKLEIKNIIYSGSSCIMNRGEFLQAKISMQKRILRLSSCWMGCV